MDNDRKFYFQTPDYFAAALIVTELNQEPEYVSGGKKTLARFSRSEKIYELLKRYTSGELKVTAIQFVETIKRIRGDMIRFRERAGENND